MTEQDLPPCLCCAREGKTTALVSVEYRPYNHGTQMQMVATVREGTYLCLRHATLLRTCLLRAGATLTREVLPGREVLTAGEKKVEGDL